MRDFVSYVGYFCFVKKSKTNYIFLSSSINGVLTSKAINFMLTMQANVAGEWKVNKHISQDKKPLLFLCNFPIYLNLSSFFIQLEACLLIVLLPLAPCNKSTS